MISSRLYQNNKIFLQHIYNICQSITCNDREKYPSPDMKFK